MFGKWFASTYTGSMIGAGANVFAVWSWIVANAGPDGLLEINPTLLAAMIGEPVEAIEKALAYLQAPDDKSRSDVEGGRRIVHVEAFLYSVVNHEKYRAMRDEEKRRAQNREAQRRRRQKVTDADCQQASAKSAAVSPRQKTEDRGQKTEEKRESPPKVATKPLPPEAIEIAQYLYEAIRSHSPGFLADAKPAAIERKLTSWARDIDRGCRLDGMTPQGCRDAIDAAHRSADGFWRPNLLSGAKLRKHYEKLRIKSKTREPERGASPDLSNEKIEALDAFFGATQ